MHVNNIQSQPSVDLNLLSQSPVKALPGSWKGRSAVLIQADTNSDNSIAKLMNAAQSQFQKIDQNASLSSSKATNPPPSLVLSRDKQVQFMGTIAEALQTDDNRCLYFVTQQNGKTVAKNVNHEDFKNAPLPEGAKIVAAFEHEGRLVVPGRKNDELEIDEIHDENGQVREFQFLALDDDLYSQFQGKLELHVNKFIEMKNAQNLEKPKNLNQDDKNQPALSEKVNNIKNRVLEINRTDQKIEAKKEDKPLEQNLGVFSQIFSTLLKHVEAEKVKEKEEIELERKNLDKKHFIIQKSINLFDLFQERIKAGSESEEIALSEQNHMLSNRSFKPLELAKTNV